MGVIGAYFFEDKNAITLNGGRYRNMITEFVWLQLEEKDLENI